MWMHEVDVTVTDLMLAGQCIYYSYQLCGQRLKHELYFWLCIYFAAIASAAFFGALYHGAGFFDSPSTVFGSLIWRTVLVSGASAALSFWMMGKSLLTRHARLSSFGKAIFIGFNLFIILWGLNAYYLITLASLPGIFLFLYGLVQKYATIKNNGFFWCIASLMLLAIASLVQCMQFSPSSALLTPNAFYHIGVMISNGMLFYGGSRVVHIFYTSGRK